MVASSDNIICSWLSVKLLDILGADSKLGQRYQ